VQIVEDREVDEGEGRTEVSGQAGVQVAEEHEVELDVLADQAVRILKEGEKVGNMGRLGKIEDGGTGSRLAWVGGLEPRDGGSETEMFGGIEVGGLEGVEASLLGVLGTGPVGFNIDGQAGESVGREGSEVGGGVGLAGPSVGESRAMGSLAGGGGQVGVEEAEVVPDGDEAVRVPAGEEVGGMEGGKDGAGGEVFGTGPAPGLKLPLTGEGLGEGGAPDGLDGRGTYTQDDDVGVLGLEEDQVGDDVGVAGFELTGGGGSVADGTAPTGVGQVDVGVLIEMEGVEIETFKEGPRRSDEDTVLGVLLVAGGLSDNQEGSVSGWTGGGLVGGPSGHAGVSSVGCEGAAGAVWMRGEQKRVGHERILPFSYPAWVPRCLM